MQSWFVSTVLKLTSDFLNRPNLIHLVVWVADKFHTDMELSYLRLKFILRIHLYIQHIIYFVLTEIVLYWQPYKTYILFLLHKKFQGYTRRKTSFILPAECHSRVTFKWNLSATPTVQTLYSKTGPCRRILCWTVRDSFQVRVVRTVTLYLMKSVTQSSFIYCLYHVRNVLCDSWILVQRNSEEFILR